MTRFKPMKVMRLSHLFSGASVLPLCTIVGFSIFVVWQWCNQPPFNPSFDRAAIYPVDGVAIGLSTNHPDARIVVSNPENLVRINDVPFEEGISCPTEKLKEESIATLVHNLTDDELFARAVAEGLRKPDFSSASTTSVDCLHSDQLKSRSHLPSDSSMACSNPCDRENSGSPEAAKVKIAFMFMITTSLPFEPLWTEFFSGKGDLYNIYVHADPFRADLFLQNSIFWNRLIPSRKADRGSPSLVVASNRLVANAMLDDPLNQYFALLSGTCIPVRSFDHVYDVLTASKQSFVEQIHNESIMWERYSGRDGGSEIMLPEIPFDQFRKAAQWFVFTRKHALMVLQDVHDRKYWFKFDRKCVIYFCGTDEHYYPTLLHILDPDGVTGTTVTYVQWPDWVTEHPWMFYPKQVTSNLIRDIQRKDGEHYLFARKFHESTVDLLMNFTDTILQ